MKKKDESGVIVIGPRDDRRKYEGVVNTCSHSNNWALELSPFILGPVTLPDGRISRTMENAWQYAKLYPEHADEKGNPTKEYVKWSLAGMNNPRAVRYPMGKGRKPLCLILGREHLGYVTARKRVYFPLYRDAVLQTCAWRKLKRIFAEEGRIVLWDFDGYERGDKSLKEVFDDPNRKAGHAFVLVAMLIYGELVDPFKLP
jgi:hypothetical protein